MEERRRFKAHYFQEEATRAAGIEYALEQEMFAFKRNLILCKNYVRGCLRIVNFAD